MTKRDVRLRKQWKRVYNWQRYQEKKKGVDLPFKITSLEEFKSVYSGAKNINQIKYYIKYQTSTSTAKAIRHQVRELGIKDIGFEEIKRFTTRELLENNPDLVESIKKYRKQMFELGFSKKEVRESVSSLYFGS